MFEFLTKQNGFLVVVVRYEYAARLPATSKPIRTLSSRASGMHVQNKLKTLLKLPR